MKRPEGFDRPAPVEPPAAPKPPRAGNRAPGAGRPPERPWWLRLREDAAANVDSAPDADASGPPTSAAQPGRPSPDAPRRPAMADAAPRTAPLPDRAEPRERHAAADLRRAERARRRYERSEVRRFTRRSRRRRVTWSVALGTVVTMVAIVAIAVYSPLLALRSIEIEGTERLDPVDLHAAIDDQLGTPLALVDFDSITQRLGDFPLIRSYVTETVPPNTLIIHIVEREPIGTLQTASGFALVDPAGIVIERSQARLPGVPLIDAPGDSAEDEGFSAAVQVLLAVPDGVLAQLDTVTATTRDDVRLTLAGSGAVIIWGSADDSDAKARALTAVLALDLPNVTEYNVSAPGQFTYR